MEEEKKGCGCHHGQHGEHEHHEHGEGCGYHHGHHGHAHPHEDGEVGCGCHHKGHCHHEHGYDDEPVNIAKLIDEEGKEHECLHIATIEFEGNWYAIFQAMEEDDADEDTVTILQIVEENGEERLIAIEEQDRLDKVFEEFCRLMDEEEAEEE